MHIEGSCHCGNITFVLEWPGDGGAIPVRSCSCTFCTMHGGTYTSHREAELAAVVHDEDLLSRYRFGTRTADFYICRRCGAVPFVTSEIKGRLYAVVNVNTFQGVDRASFEDSVRDFAGESTDARLDRREVTWIPSVRISYG